MNKRKRARVVATAVLGVVIISLAAGVMIIRRPDPKPAPQVSLHQDQELTHLQRWRKTWGTASQSRDPSTPDSVSHVSEVPGPAAALPMLAGLALNTIRRRRKRLAKR